MNPVNRIGKPITQVPPGCVGGVGPAQRLIHKLLNGKEIMESDFMAIGPELQWSYSGKQHHYVWELARRAHLLLFRLARRIEAGELLPVGFPSYKEINNAISSYDCPVETGPFREVLDSLHSHLVKLTPENLRWLGKVMRIWEKQVFHALPHEHWQ
jgi:hypothetical protein